MTDTSMTTDQELKKTEFVLKEKELMLKAEELASGKHKPLWWSGPLGLAVIGGLLAWGTNMFVEPYKASEARDAKTLEAALDIIKAAAASNNIEHTRINLQFIIDVELAPVDLRQRLKAYLNRPDAPLPSGIGTAGPTAASVGAGNATASDAARTPPPSQPASTGETGWFYLGKTNAEGTKWVASSAIGTFELVSAGVQNSAISVDQTVDTSLVGKTVRTLSPKYLRDGGVPGLRVQSPVKRTLNPGTFLKIKSIDNIGRDGGLPVLWAEVEVQGRQ